MHRITPLVLAALCCACSSNRVAHTPSTTTQEPLYEKVGRWSDVETSLRALPSEIQELLGSEFYERLSEQTGDSLFRVKLAGDELPLFPGYPISLHMKSPYDQEPLAITVRAPLVKEASDVTLILGEPSEYRELLADRSNAGWVIVVPSRPGLNYQLTAEGELWHCLDLLSQHYPQLQGLPLYLVGSGTTADAALLLANEQRYRFSGVAYSGGSLGLTLKNLDHLPVASFAGATETTPWGGDRLAERLMERGNEQAASELSSVVEALTFLHNQKKTPFAPVALANTSQNTLWPGVQVLTRQSEEEPAVASGVIDDTTLVIDASNILSLRITRSELPKNIHKIRVNHDLFLLPPQQDVVQLGEESLPKEWPKKGLTPSRRSDFFRNEPLVIVYSESGSKEFQAMARGTGEQFAALRFVGLPQHAEVKFPVLPLSEYLTSLLPPHRLIFIGTTEESHQILEETAGYLPVGRQTAYSLVYPPERRHNCRLAWSLAANNEEDLQRVTQEALLLTSLYAEYDLKSYEQDGRTTTHVFDSYWGNTNSSASALTIPQQSRFAWETYLEDLLIEETGSAAMILSPLTEAHRETPKELSRKELEAFIPDRNFALIKLRASSSAAIGNRLIAATNDAQVHGLERFMEEGRFDSKKLRAKEQSLLVEVDALSTLNSSQLAAVQHTIFPYSLHDLLQRRLESDAHELGRNLIRLGQSINPEGIR